MVVLASSIVTKNGKALVSRQFVDMTRIRIEGLLAAFPKLVGSGKQHTYVETENVRYVYQPLEALYLLLVTNKASNILEDLETLRLLAKVVPEYVPSMDEEGVSQAAFELLFAFDEVISLGHKDNVTVSQVKQNTEMESHEEKLHKMIIQSKINDTKDLMKRKAMEIDKSKIDRREGGGGGGGGGRMPGYSTAPGMGGISMESQSSYQSAAPAVKGLGLGDRSSAGGKKGPSKGMQLGKAKKGANDFLEAMAKEGESVAVDNGNSYKSGPAATAAPAHTEPVGLAVEEKLTVLLNKDGGMENMEVQGSMSLQVYQEEELRVRVAVTAGENAGFQFKTHPNIDKTLYAEQSVLGLKDPSRPFPAGNPLGILKWRYQTRDESLVPLSINCWPSVSGGESYVNIEYEATADFDLQNVVISIPLPALSQAPRVPQIDGDWRYDSRHSQLVWSIDLIDASNRSGAAEFVVPATDPGTFFPVEVSFSAPKTLCDIQVSSVTTTDSGAPVKYAYNTTLVTDEYQVA